MTGDTVGPPRAELGFLSILSSLTSSSALLPLWSPPHLTHFPLGCHRFIWLASLVLAPPPASSRALSAYTLTLQLVTALVQARVRWEQVVPQDANWPDCVTLALAHTKSLFRCLILRRLSSWYKKHAQRERAQWGMTWGTKEPSCNFPIYFTTLA